MSPLVVIGGASVLAIGIGLAAAGVLEHVMWRLAEGQRRRRALRRHGYLDDSGRPVR